MKRLFTTLLVAILLVTSFTIVASAATVVEPGDSSSLSVKVSNANGFNYFTAKVTVDPTLTVTGASGGHINQVSGNTVYFLWDSTENVTEKFLTINVQVSASAAPGFYGATSVSAEGATVIVPGEDGAAGTVEYTSVSAGCSQVEVVAPECEHAWGDWEVTEEPTCTKVGKETRTCSKCGETETRDVPMVAHKWGEWKQTKAPTCTAKGEETRECSVCGEKETRPLDLVAHKWGDWKVTKKATCTAEGSQERVCSVCGEKETKAIAKVAHDWATDWSTDKDNHWHVCRVCGEKKDVGAHKWKWIVDEKPGADKTGKQHEECEICHLKRSIGTVIPAIPGLDDVPQTGDITPYIALGFLSMISMLAAAVYVIKRKFAK